jgi:ABC-type Mn2+/Zn2+ transport system permease subunit
MRMTRGDSMIYFFVGLCVFGVFDFFELLEQNNTREKIIFGVIFAAALALGVYYISAYDKPGITRSLIDYFNMRDINY